ncbi:MAG TPA: hypothetical protein DCS48_12510 [Desulfovibrio sp.]|nr:hypothetical protein [Desulfovibrio sp.]
MTVVSSGNAITFAGDGAQTVFDFNFRIFNADDLCAVVRNGDGKQKTLVAGSDFKIISDIGADSGGKVQYPVSGSPLRNGESITLFREIAYTQDLELVDNDPFSARLLNEAFDRGVMRDQQLQEQVDRALKYDISTPGEDRLSPQKLVMTISSARDEAVSARTGAVEAEGNTRGMLNDAKAAQAASEVARDNALEAQAEAEKARDAAIKISVGDISELRSPAPILSGPAEAPEGTTVSIIVSNYQNDGITSYGINTGGFGSALISGNTIKWTLGTVDADISKQVEVVCRRRGELYSDTAIYRVLVKKIIVQNGPTIAFADSVEGYPGATVSEGSISAPAHSVGLNNSRQIVSAKPEITVVGVSEIPAGFGVKLGAGVTGEYLGPKKNLTLKKAVPGSNILPKMTGPATGGCIISCSSNDGGFPAWKVGNRTLGGGSNDMWIANVTAGVVTTADLTFTFNSVKIASGLRFILGPFDGASSDYQCRTVKVFLDNVPYKTFNMGDISTGPRPRDLLFGENKSFTVMKLRCSNSTSGKWIGSKDIEILGAGTSAPSTKKVLVVVGSESNKDKILKADGVHKTIIVGDNEVEVESVNEVKNAGGEFVTTIILKTALANAPSDDTEIVIPDRCTLSPANYTHAVDGDDLKITGAEIALEDNPKLKRLAMAVKGDGVKFKGGKIYIKEKP